jgi:hypothetical protein
MVAEMNPRMRARVIAEWRGLPEEAFPRDTSKTVQSVLTKVIAELGLEGRMREEEILAAWKSIVGEFVAQHSSPQRLVEGVLYVRVLQPSMHFELERSWRTEILKKLKHRFGRSIRDVRFRVG